MKNKAKRQFNREYFKRRTIALGFTWSALADKLSLSKSVPNKWALGYSLPEEGSIEKLVALGYRRDALVHDENYQPRTRQTAPVPPPASKQEELPLMHNGDHKNQPLGIITTSEEVKNGVAFKAKLTAQGSKSLGMLWRGTPYGKLEVEQVSTFELDLVRDILAKAEPSTAWDSLSVIKKIMEVCAE